MSTLPLSLPFIRWANVSVIEHASALFQRRIYDHEFVYVVAGKGIIEVAGRKHIAIAERLFLIQPRIWHSFLPDENTPLHLMGAHFDWQQQHDTLTFPIFSPASEPVEQGKFRTPYTIPGWDLSSRPFLDLQGRTEVRQALEAVVAEYNRYEEESRDLAGALLAAAILKIQRAARELELSQQTNALGADAMRRLERARILLETSLNAPLSVDEVARRVGWSGDHLRRVFRIALGLSPSQVQTSARLQLARDLLRHEELSISEIGTRCGFEDASHFARAFKKFTGLTPRQYSRLAKRL